MCVHTLYWCGRSAGIVVVLCGIKLDRCGVEEFKGVVVWYSNG